MDHLTFRAVRPFSVKRTILNKKQIHSTHLSDRFIPNNSISKLQNDYDHFRVVEKGAIDEKKEEEVSNIDTNVDNDSEKAEEYVSLFSSSYKDLLMSNILDERGQGGQKLLRIGLKESSGSLELENYRRTIDGDEFNLKQSLQQRMEKKHKLYKTEKKPHMILSVDGHENNFYNNDLDWSLSNVIAVGIRKEVILYSMTTKKEVSLFKCREVGYLETSVRWNNDSSVLAVGDNKGRAAILDATTGHVIRTIRGHHTKKINTLDWNNAILTTGGADSLIFNYDVRISNPLTFIYHNHVEKICKIKWNHAGDSMASGGNDNLVNIWDYRKNFPLYTMDESKAAVKAIDWCPWQRNILATGGGYSDKTIRLWDVSRGSLVERDNSNNSAETPNKLLSKNTGSQITELLWSPHTKELVSSHGYCDHDIKVWDYDDKKEDLKLEATLKHHTDRILSMKMSPSGEDVCTISGDDTLRIWKLFQKPELSSSYRENQPSWYPTRSNNRKGFKNRFSMTFRDMPHRKTRDLIR